MAGKLCQRALVCQQASPSFSAAPIPLNRYNGATRQRIWDATTTQYLSGFWNDRSGIALHTSWVDGTASNRYSSAWVLSVDQVGDALP
jgi:hypothetical protein